MNDINVFTAPGIDGYLCKACSEPMEEVEEHCDVTGPVMCVVCDAEWVPAWDRISQGQRDSLCTWYNRPMHALDTRDKTRLADLYHSGNFRSYDCAHCWKEVFDATPDRWDDFLGVNDQPGVGELCADCADLCDRLQALRGY